jgi:hypothetical protein
MKRSIVGFVKMEYPRRRSLSEGIIEQIKIVGFDTDGQAWGLVERMVPIKGAAGAGRLDYSRWIRFNSIPFAESERILEGGGWVE